MLYVCRVRRSTIASTRRKVYDLAVVTKENRNTARIIVFKKNEIMNLNIARKAITVNYTDLWKIKRKVRQQIERKIIWPVKKDNTQRKILASKKVQAYETTELGIKTMFKITCSSANVVLCGDSIINFTGDGIVNAANESCLGGGGIDGAVNAAGGPALHNARRCLPIVGPFAGVRCETGDAKVTIAGDLFCDHVIHAVGPAFQSYLDPLKPIKYLQLAYENSLKRAKEFNMKTVAFCTISGGIYRGSCPLDLVMKIAVHTITQNLYDGLENVYFCGFTHEEQSIMHDIASICKKGMTQLEKLIQTDIAKFAMKERLHTL